ncbi:MAG: DUF2339 domain-containing protein [Sedimenticola sp.]|nr:DUF2339 domain-containing protein [Sedimenticola sp.]
MAYILAILGGVLATGALGLEATVFGALIGYLLGAVYQQGQRLQRLSQELDQLKGVPVESRRQETPKAAHAHSTAAPPSRLEAEPSEIDFDLELPDEPEASTPVPVHRSPPPAQEAPQPTLASRLAGMLQAYFSGGNLIVRVGIIVLFFGVAFLLKYAADNSYLPIELRLAGVALSGVVMLVLGWRLRQRRILYALALQGGAVGVLYLTVFSALRLYSVLPAGLAFGLLLLFVVLATLLALLQDAASLAILATAGGFLAPVLTSTGEGSHVALFSYYLLLNAGVLSIAWFKAWRLLNLVGFAFTFVIAGIWGYRYYQPEFFATTEPFLVAFFLMYLAISVLFALRQPPNLRGLIDATLVFGVPLVSAALQAALVKDLPFGLAYSALALGALYLLLAMLLFRRADGALRLLAETFLAIGVVFTTLAVPFALEGRLTSAFWALEGAAMIWIGIRQSRRLPRLFGSVLQLLAGLLYLEDPHWVYGQTPLLNSHFLGAALIGFAGLFSAFWLDRNSEQNESYERLSAPLLFLWGLAWWLGAGLQELDRFTYGSDQWTGILVFLAVTALLGDRARVRFEWPRPRMVSLALLPALLPVALFVWLDQPHLLAGYLLIAWPVALAGQYLLLWRLRDGEGVPLDVWHVGSLGLLTFLLTAEAAWQLDQAVAGARLWEMIPWGAVPTLIGLLLLSVGQRLAWPVQRHIIAYNVKAMAVLAVYLLGWAMLANVSSPGNPWPLDYMPLLNPLDLTILFALLLLARWWQQVGDWMVQSGVTSGQYHGLLGVAFFLWCNGMVARSVHHWGGVPFDAGLLFQSQVLQASIAVLWAVLGLSCMLAGNRFRLRPLWLAGAGLMGLVVIKLFLFDLSNTGTVARIVAFIGVGLLLMVVGYFSPAPPRDAEPQVAGEGKA